MEVSERVIGISAAVWTFGLMALASAMHYLGYGADAIEWGMASYTFVCFVAFQVYSRAIRRRSPGR